jgi:hypothetical protein
VRKVAVAIVLAVISTLGVASPPVSAARTSCDVSLQTGANIDATTRPDHSSTYVVCLSDTAYYPLFKQASPVIHIGNGVVLTASAGAFPSVEGVLEPATGSPGGRVDVLGSSVDGNLHLLGTSAAPTGPSPLSGSTCDVTLHAGAYIEGSTGDSLTPKTVCLADSAYYSLPSGASDAADAVIRIGTNVTLTAPSGAFPVVQGAFDPVGGSVVPNNIGYPVADTSQVTYFNDDSPYNKPVTERRYNGIADIPLTGTGYTFYTSLSHVASPTGNETLANGGGRDITDLAQVQAINGSSYFNSQLELNFLQGCDETCQPSNSNFQICWANPRSGHPCVGTTTPTDFRALPGVLSHSGGDQNVVLYDSAKAGKPETEFYYATQPGSTAATALTTGQHIIAADGQKFDSTVASGTGDSADGYPGTPLEDGTGLVGAISVRASGMPILSTVYRSTELEHGINHPLNISGACQNSFIYPASGGPALSKTCAAGTYLPYGTLLRLRPDFSDSGLPAAEVQVIKALKRYGFYFDDLGCSCQDLEVEKSTASYVKASTGQVTLLDNYSGLTYFPGQTNGGPGIKLSDIRIVCTRTLAAKNLVPGCS